MGVSVFPAPVASSKTMYRTTLTSGTSYTVPAGVTYLNVTLFGGGGAGGQSAATSSQGALGAPGQTICSTLSATAGSTISYSIGAGGVNGTGGTTTFTGATSAAGGTRANLSNSSDGVGTPASRASNQGLGCGSGSGGSPNGGAGFIEVEYWA